VHMHQEGAVTCERYARFIFNSLLSYRTHTKPAKVLNTWERVLH
jgi:hypothetical protein